MESLVQPTGVDLTTMVPTIPPRRDARPSPVRVREGLWVLADGADRLDILDHGLSVLQTRCASHSGLH
jgi:hypothetical protein